MNSTDEWKAGGNVLQDKGIKVIGYTWRMNVNLAPFMERSPLSNIEKLFRYMRERSEDNQEAFQTLAEWLPQEEAHAKNLWHDRSQEYVNGFKDVSLMRRGDARAEANRNNALLEENVRKSKRLHEKLIKVNIMFHEYTEKYRIAV